MGRFFSLEVDARLVTTGLLELGIDDIYDTPELTNLPDPDCSTKEEKKKTLKKLATHVVDRYALNKSRHDAFVTACKKLEVKESEQRRYMTLDGKYMFCFAGCKSTFVHDGQRQTNHKLKHNPPVVTPDDEEQCDACFEEKPEEVDDMFNFQKALLEYGMGSCKFAGCYQ